MTRRAPTSPLLTAQTPDDTQPHVCWPAVLLGPVAPLMTAECWLAAVVLLVLALVVVFLGKDGQP